jgi:hypothetical protein
VPEKIKCEFVVELVFVALHFGMFVRKKKNRSDGIIVLGRHAEAQFAKRYFPESTLLFHMLLLRIIIALILFIKSELPVWLIY